MGENVDRVLRGFMTRTFDGAEVAVNVPSVDGLVCWVPSDVTDAGYALLKSMCAVSRIGFVTTPIPLSDRVNLIVGTENLKQLTDLPMRVMRGVVGVWGDRGEAWVGVAVDHPDSLLMDSGDRKRERRTTVTDVVHRATLLATGEASVIDELGRECVVCLEKAAHDIDRNYNVTELDKHGLGLCRVHSGYDVRPVAQRWEQEKMF